MFLKEFKEKNNSFNTDFSSTFYVTFRIYCLKCNYHFTVYLYAMISLLQNI